jgi:hypothetical protein
LVSLEGYDQHGSLIRESRMYQARRLVHSHCTDWCSPHLNHKGLLR